MEIRGYKAFDKNMNNRYGQHFEEGHIYSVSGPISFGNSGNGFHFCERLEDTLRYVDGMGSEIRIAEVIGRGNIIESFDTYNGYYNMYSAQELEIVKVLGRTEIVSQFINIFNSDRVKRFIQGYRLTEMEKAWFRACYIEQADVLKTIAYYQDGNKNVFEDNDRKVYKKGLRHSDVGENDD